MMRRAVSSSGASKIPMPVLTEPSVGPANEHAVGQEAPEPLGMRGYTAFGGLKLPARDLAKLGYLYLNGGRWDGVQIVTTPRTWSARRSSRPPPVIPEHPAASQSRLDST
jgi:CubicO group peptidase (beta-lactamase class C family)